MNAPRERRKVWLGVGGLGVALLLAAVFTLGSLNLPFEPSSGNQMVILYALSTFIVAALLVFGLVLTRSLLRVWAERRAGQLGSRFKTKMVAGAMAISLLPVVFLFLISYALLNRTLSKWFPRPLEIANEQSQALLVDLGRSEHERLVQLARQSVDRVQEELRRESARAMAGSAAEGLALFFAEEAGADAAWVLDGAGRVVRVRFPADLPASSDDPRAVRVLASGAEVWQLGTRVYLGGRAALSAAQLVAARRMPDSFLDRYAEIEAQRATYEAQRQGLRAFKMQMVLTLLLFTLLLLFAATWFALFLSKRVTVPIQALAEAMRAVSGGHFNQRVEVQAHDELGTLVDSFNQMTTQLGQSRRQIDEFTRSLQQAVGELERRRKMMEAILENIPTGVLSLEADGRIRRGNPAVARIFGERGRTAQTLFELLGVDAARDVELLMRKSLRMGVASKELEIALPDRVLHAALTVSSLGPRRSNPGFIVVVDDLTELLRAQKAAAWQEVAQRIAHEIKNPLTPIQLSAERLTRHLQRAPAAGDPEWASLVGECAALIEREVATLKALVDEFSQFVRFPTAKPIPADLNAVVGSALEVFRDRLEGITLHTELAAELPPVRVDPELLRRVLVNLVDNAAEAMEGAARRTLTVTTRLDSEQDAAEVAVADSGHGISPEDKDRLFLPHFSTKARGTGLGLAIASRIVAEHHGTIRVEDNPPAGARFVIRLPLAEVPAAPRGPGTFSG